MLYESADRTDDAIAAYERAIELDPDDEQGAKSYAEGRLESLQGSDAAEDDASAEDGSEDATGEQDDASADQTSDGSASE